MKVSVVGLGYLGAVHATALAHLGFQVVGVDIDEAKVGLLSTGRAPFHEPGFDELLAEVVGRGDLTFTTDFHGAASADVHFLCVGTPQAQGSRSADLTHLWSAVRVLATVARSDSLIVGKSTVPVGTAAEIQGYLRDRLGSAAPSIAWNPEFLREGFAVTDSLSPDRIVIGLPDGADAAAGSALRTVYSAQIEAGIPYLETDLATAELVKAAANAFLATKISFINAMSVVCEAASADVVTLADAIGHDVRIGRRFLNAGLGFGGGCLPKDVRAFAARADDLGVGDAVSFLSWVDEVNLNQRQNAVANAVEMCGGSVANCRITLLGGAFKPDSDDVRDAPGLWIAENLAAMGADVVIHDPQALPGVRRTHPQLGTSQDIGAALRGSDLVILATEWREYVELDPAMVADLVTHRCIIDGRNALDAGSWVDAGWQYRGVGRGSADHIDLRTASTTGSPVPASSAGQSGFVIR